MLWKTRNIYNLYIEKLLLKHYYDVFECKEFNEHQKTWFKSYFTSLRVNFDIYLKRLIFNIWPMKSHISFELYICKQVVGVKLEDRNILYKIKKLLVSRINSSKFIEENAYFKETWVFLVV